MHTDHRPVSPLLFLLGLLFTRPQASASPSQPPSPVPAPRGPPPAFLCPQCAPTGYHPLSHCCPLPGAGVSGGSRRGGPASLRVLREGETGLSPPLMGRRSLLPLTWGVRSPPSFLESFSQRLQALGAELLPEPSSQARRVLSEVQEGPRCGQREESRAHTRTPSPPHTHPTHTLTRNHTLTLTYTPPYTLTPSALPIASTGSSSRFSFDVTNPQSTVCTKCSGAPVSRRH